MDSGAEVALRAHIRAILHDYVLEHMAINSLSYTVEQVSNFISNTLAVIPTHEPSAVALPVDPFETLKSTKLDSINAYEESLALNENAISYIKSQLCSSKHKLKTQRIWGEGAEDEYKYVEPFSPILSRESRKMTPRIGKKIPPSASLRFVDKSLKDIYQAQNLKQVEVENYHEPSTALDKDACLDMKFDMDHSTVSAISELKKKHPFLSKTLDGKKLRGESNVFLSRNSPDLDLKFLCPISPPLFARRKKRRNAQFAGPKTIAEATATLVPVEIPDSSLDLQNENMMIVDGWTTIRTSPSIPATPSLVTSTSEDELEDCWLPTSEADSIGPTLAANTEMEVYQFPRQKRVRNGLVHTADSPSKDRRSLTTFLSKIIPDIEAVADEGRERFSPFQSLIPAPVSLLGQLGSECESCPNSPTTQLRIKSDDNFKVDIDTVLLDAKSEQFRDPIMRERLSDSEGVFMDVPFLQPVHEILKGPSRPKDMQSLVRPKEAQGATESAFCLEAVTGVKSLNLELSWRPFNFGQEKPTNEQITETQKPFTHEEIDSLTATDKEALTYLLVELESEVVKGHESGTRFMLEDLDEQLPDEPSPEVGFLFNRMERRRQKIRENDVEVKLSKEEVPDCSYQRLIEAEALEILNTNCYKSPYPATWSKSAVDGNLYDVDKRKGLGQLMYESTFDCDDSLSTLDDLEDNAANLGPHSDFLGFQSQSRGKDNILSYPENDYELGDTNTVMEPTTKDAFFTELNTVDAIPGNISFEREITGSVASVLSGGFDKFTGRPEDPVDSTYMKTDGPSFISTGLLCDQNTFKTSLFLSMRQGCNVSEPSRILSPPTRLPTCEIIVGQQTQTPFIEEEHPPTGILNDPSYLRPHSPWASPNNICMAMVSLDTFQKRALIKALTSDCCKIRPVGRKSLNDVDIILDSDAAILLFQLSALPSQNSLLSSRVCKSSWNFGRLTVVFEAFPASSCFKAARAEGALPFAYGPPVLKAIKRFRRDLAIREEVGDSNPECSIQIAFADSVQEAAILSRMIADASNTKYILTEDDLEGEDELASMIGMNAFAANVILQATTLDEFLGISASERLETFGTSIGYHRVEIFNAVLSSRLAEMENLECSSQPTQN